MAQAKIKTVTIDPNSLDNILYVAVDGIGNWLCIEAYQFGDKIELRIDDLINETIIDENTVEVA